MVFNQMISVTALAVPSLDSSNRQMEIREMISWSRDRIKIQNKC